MAKKAQNKLDTKNILLIGFGLVLCIVSVFGVMTYMKKPINKDNDNSNVVVADRSLEEDNNLVEMSIGEKYTIEEIVAKVKENKKLDDELFDDDDDDGDDEYTEKQDDTSYEFKNNSDENVILVNDKEVTALSNGKSNLSFVYGGEEYNVTISVDVANSEASVSKAEVIAQFKMPDLDSYGDKNKDKTGYYKNKYSGYFTNTVQDFDVKGNYVYISVPLRGICKVGKNYTKSANECNGDISTVRIYRFSKKDIGALYDVSSEGELHKLVRSGHGTVFNVINRNTDNKTYMLTGVDTLTKDGGFRLLSKEKGYDRWIGTSNKISMVTFKNGGNEDISKRSSSAVYTPLDSKGKSIGFLGGIGVDEKNKYISFNTKVNGTKKQFIYSYNFKDGKLQFTKYLKGIKVTSIAYRKVNGKKKSVSVQGVDISGNKYYLLSNSYLYKYDWKNKKHKGKYKISSAITSPTIAALKKSYPEIKAISFEPEGVKIDEDDSDYVYFGAKIKMYSDKKKKNKIKKGFFVVYRIYVGSASSSNGAKNMD